MQGAHDNCSSGQSVRERPLQMGAFSLRCEDFAGTSMEDCNTSTSRAKHPSFSFGDLAQFTHDNRGRHVMPPQA